MKKDLEKLIQQAQQIAANSALTHEQATNSLASLPGQFANVLNLPEGFQEMLDEGLLCNLSEGFLPYAPRYILPDYQKLMDEGCQFLRLKPPSTLSEAILTLEIFYRHVPSVTHYPVYLGRVDKMLEPFIDGVSEEEARREIRNFLFFLSRSIPDSYCHMNIGPEETRAGKYILDAEMKLQEAIPSITMLYDEKVTSDDFSEKALSCAQLCAKPSFANYNDYQEANPFPIGIASCYNALPIAGGAFTLSRVMISKIVDKVKDSNEFFEFLPKAVNTLCTFMDEKIRYLVEDSHFFTTNFLVKEGFVKLENFTGMVGIVGLNECVNTLLAKDGIAGRYAQGKEADELSHRILAAMNQHLNEFESKYCDVTGNHFLLHAQVGISTDVGITPGIRIAIGEEPDLYTHLKHEAKFQKYFPSGVGDIFPFDEAAKNNVGAILDIVKGSFNQGMRYFSTYTDTCDVVRVTGYLVKRSDIEKLSRGEAVGQANATWGYLASKNQHALERKVESL
ncbi:YjjI family glycine radical enzyme [Youngiibacter multivorans]|uniref:YjjI family glycine radical enzyme n=1 Tax=Youngiibacter multivorans TaxID=937251 RepID=A0ABS4G0Y7_9CLOT|nr:YjjI family glycine radical enzyme [Youngiibacter multivorans]MBP1918213.1 YjjI family glycine radical enzyme [Youngiibacter multivorans]